MKNILTVIFLLLFLTTFISDTHAHECSVNLNAPVTEPLYDGIFIRNWTSQSVANALSFSFADHQKKLQDSSYYFTKHGWQGFMDALDNSKILESVTENKQVLTTTISASPVILEEGVKRLSTNSIMDNEIISQMAGLVMPEKKENASSEDEQAYFWNVQVPIVLTYNQGTKQTTDNLIVTLIIFRSSDPNNPDGIGINQWIAARP